MQYPILKIYDSLSLCVAIKPESYALACCRLANRLVIEFHMLQNLSDVRYCDLDMDGVTNFQRPCFKLDYRSVEIAKVMYCVAEATMHYLVINIMDQKFLSQQHTCKYLEDMPLTRSSLHRPLYFLKNPFLQPGHV